MGRKKLLTKEQVLTAIQQWQLRHGKPPTIEELRLALGVGSSRTIHRYLEWLDQDKDIERWSGARGMRVLRKPNQGMETKLVPLVGEVSAGALSLAEENLEGWFRLPKSFLRPASDRFFLLRIRGNSMDRARVEGGTLQNGDIALVRQTSGAREGDIVVAVADGEATVKRLSRGSGYCILKPESSDPEYRPILVDRDFTIQGVVKRVFKRGAKLFGLDEGQERKKQWARTFT